ncbi:GntR family transcriptional regulator [Nesterenkonia alba]|uniref:GntR family transcriptional regulator n=1 Tax=Nesterenkonia alba TaxID=515814 RepID=UPI0003B55797|nr:GntR family transcriptional regulator [Nesterenkonia alba]
MLLRIEPSSSLPIFEQLAAQLRLAVINGEVRDGERLPAAQELAESLEVNKHTVLHAYQLLRDEGLVELRRGRGAVVTAQHAEQYESLAAALEVVREEARKLGVPLSAVAKMVTQHPLTQERL